MCILFGLRNHILEIKSLSRIFYFIDLFITVKIIIIIIIIIQAEIIKYENVAQEIKNICKLNDVAMRTDHLIPGLFFCL